jgi:hypothetical protein
MDWSSKIPDKKRSIPLVCELGLLERRFAKVEADDDYGETLQARESKDGWSQAVEGFLLKRRAKA